LKSLLFIQVERFAEDSTIDKYECTVCAYIFDPEKGNADNYIDPETPFEGLPEFWFCSIFGVAMHA
jgi:rubredoxin